MSDIPILEPGHRVSRSRCQSHGPPWVGLLKRPADQRSSVHIHLVGIGGAGLSAIASLLLARGYRVSGSDRRPNEVTDDLAAQGVEVFRGHAAENVLGADLVLISSAVPEDNPRCSRPRQPVYPSSSGQRSWDR